MPTFAYVARDRDGNRSEGTLSARDQTELREILRDRELFLTRVRLQAGGGQAIGRFGFLHSRVRIRDLVVMSRQFATLVRAGLSIVDCLHVLAQQSENPYLVEVLREVRLDVLTGSTLTDAVRKHPRVFREAYVALIHAGETGGVLERTLEIAASQLNREAQLREKVKSAFVYPVLVVVASFLVIVFMLAFIVPVFGNVYSQFHAELPALTRLLIGLSRVVVHAWYVLLLVPLAAALLARRYVQTQAGRRRWDQLKLSVPVLGKLNRKITVSRFTQTLSGATQAGVPLLNALAISANTSGNVVIIEAIAQVTRFIKEGATIAAPLADTGQFPPMVTQMIAAGEQSGNLDEMLDEITSFYEQDIEYAVERMTRLMEPAMTVVVGCIVLFVLASLYMPIFNLSNVIKR